MVAEKRKYVRFLAEPNTYAALGSSFTKVGKIRDISMGGLAFEYFSGTENSNLQDSTVTIFITVKKFYLENLPCLMICDHPKRNSNETHFLNSSYLVKRCSLQFMTISEDQRQHLENFLENYTQGIAPSSIGPQEINQESG
jgi:c-di-GMP-binding flagellar brake protein YcgR